MKNNILEYNETNISNSWDYENGFYLTSPVNRMGKQLAQYELYKKIVNIPGEVLEFGVYKGASIIRFATYRELLENTYSRKIIGFDIFGEFPKTDNDDDNKFIQRFEEQGGNGISKEVLEDFIKHKNINNIELIKGNVFDTLDEFLEKNKQIKISLLHLDLDVYKPTKFILEKLYERMVPGGIIVFDDYGTVKGATDAIDEFLKEKNKKIEKLSLCYIPSFVVK
ncbi:TylF/MycF/NovP-related O-methyltransferase [Paraclostridium sordellii]|uniref:TylF/MycF/NovP-related O-methyltransferase n=1 Tax=Paraclostridium sordellii TaxID=1505 RepID=UPI0005E0DBF6|nr:TylF/MycF/NovP-related O-methyltransferase [Paeniclostridium sordellii]MDU2686922.1 TylF/MycF/NovP-related O-methyltransferase [Paeniclostridium sordellii]MVO73106.1 dTDP-6-deoxy-L-hexose 3-O-methyltransferase [Paeniclostridium sordellii]CEO27790.1 CalS11 [[Clostridium] sordellii] [Paeniclostridium sordellii]CEP48308.1 CalS11 [[Clostridium] sordellii] [Paeniclostridium sordellii]